MTDSAHQLSRGREAARKRVWDEAFQAFSDAVDAGLALDAPDLETWSTAAYLTGRVETALDAIVAAHQAHVSAQRVADAVRCGFWISHMLVGRSEIAQAGGWMARCRRLIANTTSAEKGITDYCDLFESFRLIAVEGRYEEGIDIASQVVETNRSAGDPDLAALGLNNMGRAWIRTGSVSRGLEALDEAMVAVVAGELSPAAAGTVYCSMIEACEEIADLARAQEWTGALTEWCGRQEGLVMFTGQCLTHRSTIMRRRGDWPAAEEEARRASARFEGLADHLMGRSFYELGEVHRVRGESAAAEEAYTRARDAGHEPQPGLALLRLSQGRAEAAAAALDRLLTERTDPVARIPLLGPHVEVMLELSRVDEAGASAAELETAAATFATSALRAEADRASGRVLLAGGEPGEALGLLRTAHDLWKRLDAPFEAARTQVALSQACLALGDAETGALELETARAVFESLGARGELDRIPAGPGPASHGLTNRELEVLRLVATGMTNQEISDQLYLAVKTVDRHVSNILTKLSVPSRTAAAAFAYQHALI